MGDGPDADPDRCEDMDLTNAQRADAQPRRRDVLQGLERPHEAEDAGVQKEELTKDQVWAVVSYAQTLRKAQ